MDVNLNYWMETYLFLVSLVVARYLVVFATNFLLLMLLLLRTLVFSVLLTFPRYQNSPGFKPNQAHATLGIPVPVAYQPQGTQF